MHPNPLSALPPAAVLPLLLSLLAVPATAQESAPAPAPNIVVAQTVHDFGEVVRGQVLETEFEIENTGTAPLIIEGVRSSCACAVPVVPESIAPGAKSSVKVTLDTEVLQGPSRAAATLFTNDPDQPRVGLTVRANVANVIAAAPGFVRYIVHQNFEVTEETSGRITQTLWPGDDQPFQVVSVESPHPHIEATFRRASGDEVDASKPEPQWLVETVISPQAEVGALSGYLRIFTDHPTQKVVPLPVSGFVRPVWAATPARVRFGTLTLSEGDAPVTRPVHLKNFAQPDILITKVESSIDGLEVQPQVIDEGRIYSIVLSVTPETAKGRHTGTVTVHTDNEMSKTITIPVELTVQ